MSDKITISLGKAEISLAKFKSLWKKIEEGSIPNEPINTIHFSSPELLFNTMTPKRFELLRYIRQANKISIRALANGVKRDYKNVHQDIKTLLHIGLVSKDTAGFLHVPYETITTEVSLDLAA